MTKMRKQTYKKIKSINPLASIGIAAFKLSVHDKRLCFIIILNRRCPLIKWVKEDNQ
jgi:hypothetical protein